MSSTVNPNFSQTVAGNMQSQYVGDNDSQVSEEEKEEADFQFYIFKKKVMR